MQQELPAGTAAGFTTFYTANTSNFPASIVPIRQVQQQHRLIIMDSSCNIGGLGGAGGGGIVVPAQQLQQQQQQYGSDPKQRRKRALLQAQQQQQQQQDLPQTRMQQPMPTSTNLGGVAVIHHHQQQQQPVRYTALKLSTLATGEQHQQFVGAKSLPNDSMADCTMQQRAALPMQQQQLDGTATPVPTQYLFVHQQQQLHHHTPTAAVSPRHYMALKRANDWATAGVTANNNLSTSTPGSGGGMLYPLMNATTRLAVTTPASAAALLQNNTITYHHQSLPAGTATLFPGGQAGSSANLMPGSGGSADALPTMNVEEVNAALVLMSLSSSPRSPAMFMAQHAAMNGGAASDAATRGIVSSFPDRSGIPAYHLLSSSTPSNASSAMISVPTASAGAAIPQPSSLSSASWQSSTRGGGAKSDSPSSSASLRAHHRMQHYHQQQVNTAAAGASIAGRGRRGNTPASITDPAAVYFHDEGVDVVSAASSVEGINGGNSDANNMAEDDDAEEADDDDDDDEDEEDDEDDDEDEEMPDANGPSSSQQQQQRSVSKQSGEYTTMLSYDEEEPPRKRRNSTVMQFQCTWPKCRHHERSKDAIKQHIKSAHFQKSSPNSDGVADGAASGGAADQEQDQDDEEFYYYEYDPSKATASAAIRVPVYGGSGNNGSGGGGDAHYPSHSPSSNHSSQLGDGAKAGKTSARKGREVKKCRKVYGMENRELWCTQCKWKKACTRFSQD